MNANLLQDKIESLQNMAGQLLHSASGEICGNLYADDFALLNKEIHEKINELYPLHGQTVEEEALLCLALLVGYSVSMYANPEDEVKKHTILERSRKVMSRLSATPLKGKLATIYNEYENL